MEQIRIGWIGCGYHSYNLMFDCLRNTPARVVAACDVDTARLELFAGRYNIPARYADFEDMLAKETLDGVICIIDAENHYRVARRCLELGIPVFVEKTPFPTATHGEELAALQKGKAFCMTGFNRRFAMGYVMAKDIIQSEGFGRPTMYLAKYNASAYRSEAFYIFNHIVHHLDLARFLCGEITLTHVDRVLVDDTRVGFHVSFKSEKGLIGTIQSGSLQSIDFPMERVEITGIGTNVIVDNIKRVEYNRPPQSRPVSRGATLREGFDSLGWNLNHGNLIENDLNGFKDELEQFVEHIRSGTRPEQNAADSARTMALVEELEKLMAVSGR